MSVVPTMNKAYVWLLINKKPYMGVRSSFAKTDYSTMESEALNEPYWWTTPTGINPHENIRLGETVYYFRTMLRNKLYMSNTCNICDVIRNVFKLKMLVIAPVNNDLNKLTHYESIWYSYVLKIAKVPTFLKKCFGFVSSDYALFVGMRSINGIKFLCSYHLY